jgi:hypothetical protein
VDTETIYEVPMMLLTPEDAKKSLAEWLPRATDDDRPLDRFIEIARGAGFGMGIIVTNQGYVARWTHTHRNCSGLPVGEAQNIEDARLLACVAILEVPDVAEIFAIHRGPRV